MPGATPDELRLHQRLLAGDPTASAELVNRFLSPLIDALSSSPAFQDVSRREPTLIWDAVADALLDYAENPERYDPDRASLRYYLRMVAEGDLKNALERHGRTLGREVSYDQHVELQPAARNREVEDASAEHRMMRAELWNRIAEIVPDPVEREVVELMLEGERRRSIYARVLSIDHWPQAERDREVDRVKDRLKKRLKRAGREVFFPNDA